MKKHHSFSQCLNKHLLSTYTAFGTGDPMKSHKSTASTFMWLRAASEAESNLELIEIDV